MELVNTSDEAEAEAEAEVDDDDVATELKTTPSKIKPKARQKSQTSQGMGSLLRKLSTGNLRNKESGTDLLVGSSHKTNGTRQSRMNDRPLWGSPMVSLSQHSATMSSCDEVDEEDEEDEEGEWSPDDWDVGEISGVTTFFPSDRSNRQNQNIQQCDVPITKETVQRESSNRQNDNKNQSDATIAKEIIQKRQDRNDSKCFEENPLEKVPRFTRKELKLGDKLGMGEFGTVYEIDSLDRPTTLESSDHSRSEVSDLLPSGIYSRWSFLFKPDCPSMTVATATDLRIEEENLDNFLRRRFGDIQHDDLITPDILGKDVQPTNSSDDNNNSFTRRAALMLKDRKGIMISRQENADNVESFDGYAVKLVRKDIKNEHKKHVAVADMAAEAKLLSALSHPNIMRIRGIMGNIERPGSYGIIMDKLRSTLLEQIQEWARITAEDHVPRAAPEKHTILEHVPEWLLLGDSQKEKQRKLFRQTKFFADRMEAVYAISKAFKYLHEKKIVYRDLKPENVGLANNNYVMFDFGLARELRESDRVSTNPEDEDRYNATGLTGSRLFMAPEVATRKPYGVSADVYSFAILFWEVISLKEVFPTMNLNKHFKQVIVKGKRPPSLEDILPTELNEMMENSWDKDPLKRPTFESISEILVGEIDGKSNRFLQSFMTVENSIKSRESTAEEFEKLDGYDDYNKSTSYDDLWTTGDDSSSSKTSFLKNSILNASWKLPSSS